MVDVCPKNWRLETEQVQKNCKIGDVKIAVCVSTEIIREEKLSTSSAFKKKTKIIHDGFLL